MAALRIGLNLRALSAANSSTDFRLRFPGCGLPPRFSSRHPLSGFLFEREAMPKSCEIRAQHAVARHGRAVGQRACPTAAVPRSGPKGGALVIASAGRSVRPARWCR